MVDVHSVGLTSRIGIVLCPGMTHILTFKKSERVLIFC